MALKRKRQTKPNKAQSAPRKRAPAQPKPIRDDLAPAEVAWLELKANQPDNDDDGYAGVPQNPLQGRPF